MSKKGIDGAWIGVDLDGTLAYYDGWRGAKHIGEPIMPMVERVKKWLEEGYQVKIFTARANMGMEAHEVIWFWLSMLGLPDLEVTATKDFDMVELWDDRCVQVISNKGIPINYE